ncbi:MAG: hypothetical protein CEE38_17975 [Planctomycetes bacterium B3_Pla]|nr:MAG: hypothetical protein CEE38_17975 [Planctomycetes bacterium B3_Pla]
MEQKALPDGAQRSARFKPSATAAASSVAASSLKGRFGNCEGPDGSGSQATMKSPPGPNLHNGPACSYLSGIISIPFPIFNMYSRTFDGTCYYRQRRRNYPNKNRTKTAEYRVFLSPLAFDPDSGGNMGPL